MTDMHGTATCTVIGYVKTGRLFLTC
ncbi:hypothetical protein DESC_600084 [Desulfosarcina cetonica]|nr:hypothetical protein DESC_600084 [Desulfosarcina cetonica]